MEIKFTVMLMINSNGNNEFLRNLIYVFRKIEREKMSRILNNSAECSFLSSFSFYFLRKLFAFSSKYFTEVEVKQNTPHKYILLFYIPSICWKYFFLLFVNNLIQARSQRHIIKELFVGIFHELSPFSVKYKMF